MLTQSWRLASLEYRQFGDTLGGMSTQYRFKNTYRIQLRERDHPPPHVHLTGGGLDSISRYSSGREAVPRSLALACLGWDSLQRKGASVAAEPTGRYTVTRKP